MNKLINKTMDRDDLFDTDAVPTVEKINNLINAIYDKNITMTSWYGTLEAPNSEVGLDNRKSNYTPLRNSIDDHRIPWFLYWEIEWVLRNGPRLTRKMRVLDAGGMSSLFSCYLASLGLEVHSIDINPTLVENAKEIARVMDWNMHVHLMDIEKMTFEDMYFDHAFSICVFEHLDFYTKQRAMIDIHRCLKPGGWVCLTFDYLNPAPFVFGYNGFDTRRRNALDSPERLKQTLCANGLFEIVGNQDFYDNRKRYLTTTPDAKIDTAGEYTFGSMFLKKKSFF